MPNHDEEKKRFRKTPPKPPGKEFDDAFDLFARMEELEEAINNSEGTKKESLQEQYIELLKSDNRLLDKMRLEADDAQPSTPAKADQAQAEDGLEGKRSRARDSATEALLKNKIETVVTAARHRWPNSEKHPAFYAMAGELARDPKFKNPGYGRSAIRMILNGTYPAAKRFGISGL